jgi:hypothetical protein
MRATRKPEGIVYVSLTRVSTSDEPIATATIVGEEMTRWLREIDGFEGFLMLSREGTTLGLTFWQSREVADRHRVARMQFLDRITAIVGVQLEEIVEYELTFANLGQLHVDSTTTAETGSGSE